MFIKCFFLVSIAVKELNGASTFCLLSCLHPCILGIYDDFVAALTAKADGLLLGDPVDLNTQMGPLVSAKQLAILEEQVSSKKR